MENLCKNIYIFYLASKWWLKWRTSCDNPKTAWWWTRDQC